MWIRDGREDDVPRLRSIYNHYIETSSATFDLFPHSLEERRPWFDAFAASGRHRLFVAEANDAGHAPRVVGFASSPSANPLLFSAGGYYQRKVARFLETNLLASGGPAENPGPARFVRQTTRSLGPAEGALP